MINRPQGLRPILLPSEVAVVLQSFVPPEFAIHYQLLNAALPPEWRGRVILNDVEGVRWLLWVRHAIDGQQFRFLTMKLATSLAEKLSYSPQIVVRVNPLAFAEEPHYCPRSFVFQKPQYTPDEAEEIVQKFLTASSWDEVF